MVAAVIVSMVIMIGGALVAEGLDFYIPKEYIYFSMAFAMVVESINIALGKRKKSN